jgi:hypothetical protein
MRENPHVRALERFSLDDPDAGRKLAANLDARKVRLAFSELCRHFGCDDVGERARLRAFLETLKADGTLVEPELKLFCRPALAHGATGPKRRKAIAEAKRLARRMKDTALRDAEAGAILAFMRGQGGRASRAQVIEEAARLGLPLGRATYLIQHLREIAAIESVSHGVYRLREDAPAAETAAERLADDA